MADRAQILRLHEAELINAAAWLTCRVTRDAADTDLALDVLRAAAAQVAPTCPFVQAVLDAVRALDASVQTYGFDRSAVARMEVSDALARFFQFRVGQAQAARSAMGAAA